MRRSLLCLVILSFLLAPEVAISSMLKPNLLTISKAPLIITGKIVSLADTQVILKQRPRPAVKTTVSIESVVKNETGKEFLPGKQYVFDVMTNEKVVVDKKYMLNLRELWTGIWGYWGGAYGIFEITETSGKKEIVNKYMNRGLMNGVQENVTKMRVLAKDPAGTALDAKDDATTRVIQGPIELDNVIRVINKTDLIRKNIQMIKSGGSIKLTPSPAVQTPVRSNNGGVK